MSESKNKPDPAFARHVSGTPGQAIPPDVLLTTDFILTRQPPAEPKPKTEAIGSGALAVYWEDGERVYPCHCGETHRGPYALYEFGQHNCFHRVRLVAIERSDGHYMCPLCGQTFWLEREEQIPPNTPTD